MKVDLEKKLNEVRTVRRENTQKNDVLEETRKLLKSGHEEDLSMLETIAPNSSYGIMQRENAIVVEMERHEQFHTGKVFRIDQIIALGAKYRLKFLPSKKYKGYVDPAAIAEVKVLQTETGKSRDLLTAQRRNITLEEYKATPDYRPFKFDTHELQNNFFILAPTNLFETKKEKLGTFPKLPRFQIDPVLFYKIDDNNWRLIKKWGTDFTFLRAIKGFMMRTEGHFLMTVFFIGMILAVLAVNASAILALINVNLNFHPTGWFVLFGLLPFITFGLIDYNKDLFGAKYVTSNLSFGI